MPQIMWPLRHPAHGTRPIEQGYDAPFRSQQIKGHLGLTAVKRKRQTKKQTNATSVFRRLELCKSVKRKPVSLL